MSRKFYKTQKILEKMKTSKSKSNPVSYEDVSFREKPDNNDTEKRIDAHALFSMFTANIIKKKIKWFR